MTNDLQTFFVFGGNDRQLCVVFNQIASINQFAINAPCDTGFRQTWTNVQRNIHGAYSVVVMALAAIRKSYNRHFISLICSGDPHERSHTKKNLFINSSLRNHLANKC
ncbi:Uncharacterised protein [Shigella sonnei]|nr:Uncharacterised protein [Shigella sonnei]